MTIEKICKFIRIFNFPASGIAMKIFEYATMTERI